MFTKSNILKLGVYVKFDDVENEVVHEAAVVLMKGSSVIRCHYFGRELDESDENLVENVLETETNPEMFDPDEVKFKYENLATDSDDILIPRLVKIMNSYRTIMVRLTGIEPDDDDTEYVIYNDNKDGKSEFFESFMSYIEERVTAIIPTHFRDVFISTQDITEIFKSYGHDDIMYVEDSTVSNAAFIVAAFDFTLGYM